MIRIARIFAVSALAFFAAKAFAGLDGTYSLDLASLKETITASPEFQQIPEEQRGMALAIFDSMKVTMTFKDGAFSGHADVMGQVEEGKGSYTLEGDELTITVTEKNGVAEADPEVNKAKVEGDRIAIREEGMPFAIYLVKVK